MIRFALLHLLPVLLKTQILQAAGPESCLKQDAGAQIALEDTKHLIAGLDTGKANRSGLPSHPAKIELLTNERLCKRILAALKAQYGPGKGGGIWIKTAYIVVVDGPMYLVSPNGNRDLTIVLDRRLKVLYQLEAFS